jgi:endonuclease YncB( thermonuclease family)
VAKKPRSGVRLTFDIENTAMSAPVKGSHFLQSSLIEIGLVQQDENLITAGGGTSLQARPAHDSMGIWAHETIWKPHEKARKLARLAGRKSIAMQTEQEILGRFLNTLKNLPDGSELIGWNVGYTPKVVGPNEPLSFGFDVPGIVTRAARYGMDKEFIDEFGRHHLRDIGKEFAVELTKNIYNDMGKGGLDSLVNQGLISAQTVKQNSITLADEFLDFTLSRNVDPMEVYRNLPAADKAHLQSSLKQRPVKTIKELMNRIADTGSFRKKSAKEKSETLFGDRKKGVMPQALRRQAFGFQQQLISSARVVGDDTEELAKRITMGGKRFAGWAQESTQKTMMDFYGKDTDNPLVKEYARQHMGHLPKEEGLQASLKVLNEAQEHLGLADVKIASSLAPLVETLNEDLGAMEPESQKKFLKTWSYHAQRKKVISSVLRAGGEIGTFSASAISEALNPKDAVPLHGVFKSEQEFFGILGEEAQKSFGNINEQGEVHKTNKSWEQAIRGLSGSENLETKFNLATQRKLHEFNDDSLNAARQEIRAKIQSENPILKKNMKGVKGLGIAGGAIMALAIIDPLEVIPTTDQDYVDSMDPYWRHTLLGVPKIAGGDDSYNTIEGLRHGNLSGDLRGTFTDFGSGWIPGRGRAEDLSDPEFSLEPNLGLRRRLVAAREQSGLSRESFSKILREQTYDQDTHVSKVLMELAEDSATPGLSLLLHSVGQGMHPGAPIVDTSFGVALDPRVMEFRKNILQDPDAYADFQEEKRELQAEGLAELGKFARSEMFEENLSDYQGISLHASNLRAIALKDFAMEVEDADTLVLHRKGFTNIFDDPIMVRLAGIDAPEVGGHGHDPMAKWRINQDQPHGQEATSTLKRLVDQQEDLSLLIDPNQSTYGRSVGMLMGDDGVNLNMELLKEGAVAALPWGSPSGDIIDRTLAEEYEDSAAKEQRGMWKHTRYQATREMGKALGTDITFNTFTDISKLAKNPALAGYAEYLEGLGPTQYRDLSGQERSSIRGVAGELRKTGIGGRRRPVWQSGHNRSGRTFNLKPIPDTSNNLNFKLYQPSIPYRPLTPSRPPSIPLTSDDDAYLTREGLAHGGSAAAGRRSTDFGSGWKGAKNLAKLFYSPEAGGSYLNRSPALNALTKKQGNREAQAGIRENTSNYVSGDSGSNAISDSSVIKRYELSQGQNTFSQVGFDSGNFFHYGDIHKGTKAPTGIEVAREVDILKKTSNNITKEHQRENGVRNLRHSMQRLKRDPSAHGRATVRTKALISTYGQNPGKQSKRRQTGSLVRGL